MTRPLRFEFAEAVYPATSRGDRCEDIFWMMKIGVSGWRYCPWCVIACVGGACVLPDDEPLSLTAGNRRGEFIKGDAAIEWFVHATF